MSNYSGRFTIIIKTTFIAIILLMVLVGGCNKSNSNHTTIPYAFILNDKHPDHFPENTNDAVLLKAIVSQYVNKNIKTNLRLHIEEVLSSEIKPIDSLAYQRITKRLNTQPKLIENCRYLQKVLTCENQFESKNFNVYNVNSHVNQSEIQNYDSQFDQLKERFAIEQTTRIDLVLDTNLNYWRAYPKWDVRYGLLQRYINGNPHELVHHFFTEYSDVPFFQEPMAFLYGDFKGDTSRFFSRYTTLDSSINYTSYTPAKELWHFPAIVILEKNKKDSFWLFTSTLIQKFGVEKFIEFASLTTWDKTDDDFEKNFREIYSITLNNFEGKYILKN